jgi:hypothetical protein
MALMKRTQISTILKFQLSKVGLMLFFCELQLLLQLTNLPLKVKSHFLHAAFHRSDFFLLGFNDPPFLESL